MTAQHHAMTFVTYFNYSQCGSVDEMLAKKQADTNSPVNNDLSCSQTSTNCHRDFCQLQWQNKKKNKG
jgi:hypothetical protein